MVRVRCIQRAAGAHKLLDINRNTKAEKVPATEHKVLIAQARRGGCWQRSEPSRGGAARCAEQARKITASFIGHFSETAEEASRITVAGLPRRGALHPRQNLAHCVIRSIAVSRLPMAAVSRAVKRSVPSSLEGRARGSSEGLEYLRPVGHGCLRHRGFRNQRCIRPQG